MSVFHGGTGAGVYDGIGPMVDWYIDEVGEAFGNQVVALVVSLASCWLSMCWWSWCDRLLIRHPWRCVGVFVWV